MPRRSHIATNAVHPLPLHAKARQRWLLIHRWLALIIGLIFVLQGLSGSLLALKKPLLRWELGTAALHGATQARAYATSERWRESALHAYPQMSAVMGVLPPHQGFFDTDHATVFGRLAHHPGMAVAMLDAYDATPRAFFIYDELWIAKVVALHRSLLLPPPLGIPLLILSGVLLLISILSGIWLWWPRHGYWRNALLPLPGSSGRRRWQQWHQLAIWLSIPLLLLTISGIYLCVTMLLRALKKPGSNGNSVGASLHKFMSGLHDDLLLGSAGTTLVVASGIMLCLLYLTGLWLWWQRRRAA